MEISDLLKLPLQIQLAIAGGYSTYMLSYSGIKGHHSAVDTTFISFAFSFFTTLYYILTKNLLIDEIITDCIIAILATWVTGFLWRKYIRDLISDVLYKLDISWSNDDPSALATLIGDSKYSITQVGVMLEDGGWLECTSAYAYSKAPFGPCCIGRNGDIALYVNKVIDRDKKDEGIDDPKKTPGEVLLTYVPAAEIKRMTLRYKDTRSNESPSGSAADADGAASPASEAPAPVEPEHQPSVHQSSEHQPS